MRHSTRHPSAAITPILNHWAATARLAKNSPSERKRLNCGSDSRISDGLCTGLCTEIVDSSNASEIFGVRPTRVPFACGAALRLVGRKSVDSSGKIGWHADGAVPRREGPTFQVFEIEVKVVLGRG